MNTKNIVILLFSITALLFISCGGDDEPSDVAGCTDTRAENYDANATSDNGTCLFPNDKFFGSYEGSFNCGGAFAVINQDVVTFDITPPADDNEKNKVTVSASVSGIPLSLEGDVDGNQIVFVDKVLQSIPIPSPVSNDTLIVDITFSGTAELNNDLLDATLSVGTTIIIPITETCTFSGNKQ